MKYDDLLQVPYLDQGRSMVDGLDCYGLVLECFRRDGKELKDLALPVCSALARHVASLNVREVMEPAAGLGIQFMIDNRMHIGYMINKREILHMTEQGARKTPLIALSRWTPKYFEVIA